MKVGPAGIVAIHRTAASENPNCQRIYSFDADRYKRSTPPTVNELFIRQRFAAVKAAVKAREEDLSKVDADQEAFLAQRDTVGGKKTMKAYLWKLECATYDAAHPRS